MFTLVVAEKDGDTEKYEFDQPEVSIGRVAGNDIVLPKSNVSKRHARILVTDGNFVLVDNRSTNGTYVNGDRIDAPHDLDSDDKIFIGNFTIDVEADLQGQESDSADQAGHSIGSPPPPPDDEEGIDDFLDAGFGESPAVDSLAADDWGDSGEDDSDSDSDEDDLLNAMLDESEPEPEPEPEPKPKPKPTLPPKRKKAVKPPDLESFSVASVARKRPGKEDSSGNGVAAKRGDKVNANIDVDMDDGEEDAVRPVKTARSSQSVTPPSRKKSTSESVREPTVKPPVRAASKEKIKATQEASVKKPISLPKKEDVENKSSVTTKAPKTSNSVVRARRSAVSTSSNTGVLGPLDQLLADEDVTEVLVNGASDIYIERLGALEKSDVNFADTEAVMALIEDVLTSLGRSVDEEAPLIDVRLKDGSHFNAVLPPLAIAGPTLRIRKMAPEPLMIDDLVMGGTLTAEMAEFLEVAVAAKKNILVSGGTGAGKTTTLNVLASMISDEERIITIENKTELSLEQSHVVRLEAGSTSLAVLIRHALRMRPDRLVLGECRGAEALELLRAMGMGNDGSLASVHALSPKDALARLEMMVMMGGTGLPVVAIKELAARAIQIVVQQTRFPDGSRRVTHISEVIGVDGDGIILQDLFTFSHKGFDSKGRVKGKHRPSGVVASFYEDLAAYGVEVDDAIFDI